MPKFSKSQSSDHRKTEVHLKSKWFDKPITVRISTSTLLNFPGTVISDLEEDKKPSIGKIKSCLANKKNKAKHPKKISFMADPQYTHIDTLTLEKHPELMLSDIVASRKGHLTEREFTEGQKILMGDYDYNHHVKKWIHSIIKQLDIETDPTKRKSLLDNILICQQNYLPDYYNTPRKEKAEHLTRANAIEKAVKADNEAFFSR